MSSTDARRDRLARFFREELVPAAERVAGSGRSLLELGPERALSSYYTTRSAGGSYVFSSEECEDIRSLAALWAAEGHDELVPLAERLYQLSRETAPDESQTAEVSPLIYAMF